MFNFYHVNPEDISLLVKKLNLGRDYIYNASESRLYTYNTTKEAIEKAIESLSIKTVQTNHKYTYVNKDSIEAALNDFITRHCNTVVCESCTIDFVKKEIVVYGHINDYTQICSSGKRLLNILSSYKETNTLNLPQQTVSIIKELGLSQEEIDEATRTLSNLFDASTFFNKK